MAQLIHMRQRIKAVETIKKITYAMRLISMSTHSRLRNKKTYLENYKNAFQALWGRVKHASKQSPMQKPEVEQLAEQHLTILVASQKGLCGTFNTSLFRFFEQTQNNAHKDQYLIGIGKHAIDYFHQNNKTLLAAYNNFNSTNFVSIANAVTNIILNSSKIFTTVTLYSNYPKSFFIQKPQKIELLPLKDISIDTEQKAQEKFEYIFEQTPEELSIVIKQLMLSITIQELLFESLLAEQAARFLSMNTSTRNADTLLNTMKLEYNKTRQAAITGELTELAASY